MESLTRAQQTALVALWALAIIGCLPLIATLPAAWFALVLLPSACASVGIATSDWRYVLAAIGAGWLSLVLWSDLNLFASEAEQFGRQVLTLIAIPWMAVATGMGMVVGRAFAAPAMPAAGSLLGNRRVRSVLAVPVVVPIAATVVGLVLLGNQASRIHAAQSLHLDVASYENLLSYLDAIGAYRYTFAGVMTVLFISVLVGSFAMTNMTRRVEGGEVIGLTGIACYLALWQHSESVRRFVPEDQLGTNRVLATASIPLFAIIAACAWGIFAAVKQSQARSREAAQAQLRLELQSSRPATSSACGLEDAGRAGGDRWGAHDR